MANLVDRHTQIHIGCTLIVTMVLSPSDIQITQVVALLRSIN